MIEIYGWIYLIRVSLYYSIRNNQTSTNPENSRGLKCKISYELSVLHRQRCNDITVYVIILPLIDKDSAFRKLRLFIFVVDKIWISNSRHLRKISWQRSKNQNSRVFSLLVSLEIDCIHHNFHFYFDEFGNLTFASYVARNFCVWNKNLPSRAYW